jgi:hypothetical protein
VFQVFQAKGDMSQGQKRDEEGGKVSKDGERPRGKAVLGQQGKEFWV